MTNGSVSIHNVVASCHTDSKIPLAKIAMEVEGIEYEPEQFPGLVLRLNEPRAAALIFSSGKIVCTGTKSPDEAKRAVNNLIELMRSIGIQINEVKSIDIQNIVASAYLGREVNLNKIAYELDDCEYEPEQFPGLVHRMEEEDVVFLIFTSGKIICTGGKSVEQIERSIEKLKQKLKAIGAL